MPRDALPLFISDISDFTKKLRAGLAKEPETPSHLALMGLIARSAGYSNFQELKASTPPPAKPDPSAAKALRVFDEAGRMTRWPTGRRSSGSVYGPSGPRSRRASRCARERSTRS